MKELFELRRFLLILNLCLITAFSIAAPIVSGDYDGMLIGVDNEGALTGYFESSTGNGQFSCIFFVNGKSGSSPITHVDSWFPTDLSPRDVIPGTIESLAEKGQGAIRVKLKEEHGGCWNVQHFASEPVVFGLTEKGSWQAIRVVSGRGWSMKALNASVHAVGCPSVTYIQPEADDTYFCDTSILCRPPS